ncbi:hypothetical protein SmJEL517_g05179 [Synchytrium microbalum]|uniref:Signal recognition particle subunit SRP14 n=1 Tax=Synchytrium microbalum TaxID=1806994 RepID=A0A507C068_9FUNG|nr:uncharacterized protein SmJEL517_g05179 [Synchytrium microbalum]TPX31454.1 hypothetical protein SmJEL517_g05179 [Synchytrium microbalum]
MKLDKDSFLTRLGKLFEANKTTGTVWLTFKRLTYAKKKETINPPADVLEDPEIEFPCIIRATNGKIKISTLVMAGDLDKFHDALTNLCKVHMDALKKKERVKKPKKTKAKPEAVAKS